MQRRFILLLASAAMLLSTSAIAGAQSSTGPNSTSTAPKNDYSKAESWLCRPGQQDACSVDLTTTVVTAGGKLSREAWKPNQKAQIDCFYVYPTVSLDQTPNSDMVAGQEEKLVVRSQFARFGSEC